MPGRVKAMRARLARTASRPTRLRASARAAAGGPAGSPPAAKMGGVTAPERLDGGVEGAACLSVEAAAVVEDG